MRGTASLMISVFSRILWPRSRYSGDDEAASYAHKLSKALTSDHAPPANPAP
jgi:hypothetical protein